MKKIMFSDKFGLTQAVLDGRKTQTRRIMKGKPLFSTDNIEDVGILGDEAHIIANGGESLITFKIPYKVGEVVAVAQSYESLFHGTHSPDDFLLDDSNMNPKYCGAGFKNKMFVRADLMPHRICITNVRVERLQDISDEDCIAEGVVKNVHKIPTKAPQFLTNYYPCRYLKECADKIGWGCVYDTPQQAYAVLIDKISGKGTWEDNPYVFVYDFKLLK